MATSAQRLSVLRFPLLLLRLRHLFVNLAIRLLNLFLIRRLNDITKKKATFVIKKRFIIDYEEIFDKRRAEWHKEKIRKNNEEERVQRRNR